MTVTAATAARFDIGRVLRKGIAALAHRPVTLLLIGLLVTVPTSALATWARLHLLGPSAPSGDLIAMLERLGLVEALGIAAAGFSWIRDGAVAYCVGRDAAEHKLEVSELLGRLMSRAPVLYVLGMLVTLATAVGALLLFVPGVIIAIAWSLVPAVAVLERRGFLGVLRRSAEITRNHRTALFGLMLIVGVADAVLAYGLRIISGLALLPTVGVADPAFYNYLLQPALKAVFGVVSAAITTAAYLELRTIKEGLAVDGLARLFD